MKRKCSLSPGDHVTTCPPLLRGETPDSSIHCQGCAHSMEAGRDAGFSTEANELLTLRQQVKDLVASNEALSEQVQTLQNATPGA